MIKAFLTLSLFLSIGTLLAQVNTQHFPGEWKLNRIGVSRYYNLDSIHTILEIDTSEQALSFYQTQIFNLLVDEKKVLMKTTSTYHSLENTGDFELSVKDTSYIYESQLKWVIDQLTSTYHTDTTYDLKLYEKKPKNFRLQYEIMRLTPYTMILRGYELDELSFQGFNTFLLFRKTFQAPDMNVLYTKDWYCSNDEFETKDTLTFSTYSNDSLSSKFVKVNFDRSPWYGKMKISEHSGVINPTRPGILNGVYFAPSENYYELSTDGQIILVYDKLGKLAVRYKILQLSDSQLTLVNVSRS